MKIKLLFTAIYLITFVQNANSQAYIPMLNNSSWNIKIANFGGSQNLIINSGVDVTIGSFVYKKITDPYFSTDVYLREDIATRKVYRRINNSDQLLYDFSLQTSNFITLANGITYQATVSTVNVNGGTRKKISLYNFIAPSETWIEGVGSSQHPLKPTYELPSDPYIYLTCSAQNGISIYNHGIANGGNATDCSMLGIISFDSQKITFSPNPFTNQLRITTEINLENPTLRIYNSIGQVVKNIEGASGQEIVLNRENLASGIYYAQLFQNGALLTTKKIIIAD